MSVDIIPRPIYTEKACAVFGDSIFILPLLIDHLFNVGRGNKMSSKNDVLDQNS